MRLEICCENRLGITQDILEILVRHQIDLQGIEVHAEKIYLHFPSIEFAEFQHLMPEIRLINGVKDVKTIQFMPFERQHYEYEIALKSELSALVSVDEKGKIIHLNQAAINLFNAQDETELGNVSGWVKGVNIQRWLDGKSREKLLQVGEVEQQTVQLELFPIWLPGEQKTDTFSGAVIRFKLSQAPYPQANQQAFILNKAVQQASSSKKLIRDLKKLARTELPLVLEGEAGTGKHYFASLCHYLSAHSTQSVQTIECIGLDILKMAESLSAFTQNNRLGSIIFRHVDQLCAEGQSYLLEQLKQSKIPCRLIFTSQKSLMFLINEGSFDENLYQTINKQHLAVPPLREREADLPMLAEFLIRKACSQFEKAPLKLSKSALEAVKQHTWLGNVSQLEQVLTQAVQISNQDAIEVADLQLIDNDEQAYNLQTDLNGSLDEAVKRFENALLRQLYPHYPSTRQLAQKLGLSHTAIANKLRDYGINKHTVKVIKN